MARIEKTVFISYRRKDISWALAVYQYLTSQKYDVFFDFSSIPSGDFEQIIVSNIRARAHFVLILTPTALDRSSEPGDWLRREIETAVDEKRNIIPLFFDGFNFGSPSVAEKLTGKLSTIPRYNGLDIPSGYFMEAMERLRGRYLNVPLNAVIHPVSTEVRKIVHEEQVAADRAVLEKQEDIQELVKPVEETTEKSKQRQINKTTDTPSPFRRHVPFRVGARGEVTWRPYALGAGILLIVALGIAGISSLIQNAGGRETPSPTQTSREVVVAEFTLTPTGSIPTNTATVLPPTLVSTLGIGSTMTSPKDKMTLVFVPAGEFTMGEGSEKHLVHLDAFWIDQTEVTNAMYAMCVEDGECDPPDSTRSYTHDSYYGNPAFANYPVIYVSWNDANAYCSWADRRLPTEAEREKAARGENANSYPWGNQLPSKDLLNYNSIVGDTTEVGKYPDGKSIYGAFDMAGNVWEWTSSLYQPYPYSAIDGREDLDASGNRVVRGGAWGDDALIVRSAIRGRNDPSVTFNSTGFRCSRSSP